MLKTLSNRASTKKKEHPNSKHCMHFAGLANWDSGTHICAVPFLPTHLLLRPRAERAGATSPTMDPLAVPPPTADPPSASSAQQLKLSTRRRPPPQPAAPPVAAPPRSRSTRRSERGSPAMPTTSKAHARRHAPAAPAADGARVTTQQLASACSQEGRRKEYAALRRLLEKRVYG